MEKFFWETHMEPIKEGICAYISEPGIGKSNVGMAAGKNYGIFIDALGTGALTNTFKVEAQKLCAVPCAFAVYTHTHGDHVFGAHAYDSVKHVAAKGALREAVDDKDGPSDFILSVSEVYKKGDSRRTPFDIIFDKTLTLDLGGRTAHIIEMGHCHSISDSVVYIPEEKVMFCGDILFNKIGFMGGSCQFGNWLEALDKILAMDVDIFVPGHGPVANRSETRESRDYLNLLYDSAKKAKAAGTPALDLAEDIDIGVYENWIEPERLVLIIECMYRELDGNPMYPPQKPSFNVQAERIRMAKEGRRIHKSKLG
jgi:glyoxylase-like metal-dependent hydrolase (beta-lactamase superfamily II)